jgi:hypothetical protein
MIKYQEVGCPKIVIVLKRDAAFGETSELRKIISVSSVKNNILALKFHKGHKLSMMANFDALIPLRLSVTNPRKESDLRARADGPTVMNVSCTAQNEEYQGK